MSRKLVGMWCAMLLTAALSGAYAEDVLFSDNFAGKSGRPAAWKFDTTDTEFWKADNGWLNTGNGDNLILFKDGYSFAVIDTPGCDKWEDYRISCKFWAKQKNGSIGLAGRWKDRQNHYRADIDCAEGNTVVKLVKMVNGEATVLATQAVDLAALEMPAVAEGSADKSTQFSLSFEGNVVSVQLNGRQMIRQTDTTYTAGSAGLGERANEVAFGDVQVIPATAGGGLPKLATPAAPTAAPGGPEYSVLLSSDSDVAASSSLLRSLRMRGYQPFMVQDGEKQKVYVGRLGSRQEAARLQAEMVVEGFSFASVRQLSEAELAGRPAEAPATPESAVPKSVLKNVGWDDLSPAQQQKIMDTLMQSRMARANLQTAEEVLRLKEAVNNLNEQQKEIYVKVTTALDDEANVRAKARQLIEKINRAMEGRAWSEAEDLLSKLADVQPDNPLIAIKRAIIQNKKNNTFEGQEILTENQQKKIADLKDRAEKAERQGDLRAAYNLWMNVLTENPSDEELGKTANEKLQRIQAAMDAQERQRQEKAESNSKKANKILYSALGIAVSLLVLLVVAVYVSGRRRYARMLQQMHEEAIAPLQELRERTRAIAVSTPDGLAYGRQQGLLGETDSSRSEFMIPETPGQGFDSSSSPVTPEAEPSTDSQTSADDGGSGFMMSFDSPSTKEEEKKAVSAPKPDEDIVFSFDAPGFGAPTEEQTGGAITAAEVPATAGGGDEIVFSFNDSPSESSHAPAPAASAPAATDSIYESISLDDLNIDLEAPKPEPVESKPTAPGLGDLDFRLDSPMDDQSATLELPGGNPLTALDFGSAEAGPAGMEETGTAILEQNFAEEPLGAMPQGWTGESTEYASLQVAEDPADSEGKCMQFRKTEGRAPTSFSCRFPDVNGRVRVEFDLRCDDKNKHLLGLYIEADNDFRRSVHTVVQCTDPDRPAHLRVFTRPTPYTLGSWRHIRYTIDLSEGLVDGYVDDELVAEGVRMGTKTPILNTLSIRDNSETVGTLYVRNLVVAQL